MSVQLAIEDYFEQVGTLPIDQDQRTLFAWMNANNRPVSWEVFQEEWQSMTLCADCGHCVGYLPFCDNCNP